MTKPECGIFLPLLEFIFRVRENTSILSSFVECAACYMIKKFKLSPSVIQMSMSGGGVKGFVSTVRGENFKKR